LLVSRYLRLADDALPGTQTARVMLTDRGIAWSDLGISRLVAMAADLRSRIERGELQPGEQVPSLDQLAR
jgi:hypothetical protein